MLKCCFFWQSTTFSARRPVGFFREADQLGKATAVAVMGSSDSHSAAAAEPAVGGAGGRARRQVARREDQAGYIQEIHELRPRRGDDYTGVHLPMQFANT